jgi:hypothetical protein
VGHMRNGSPEPVPRKRVFWGIEKAMQTAVVELARMGSLPMSADADPKIVERWQNLLAAVKTPVSDDEARALVRVFGPDDCFGLAWTLLHLIETAHGPRIGNVHHVESMLG